MRRRFFLIHNPTAGRDRRQYLDAVVAELGTYGASIERCRGASIADVRMEATAAARSGSFDAIVAAGGDGTVRQAVAAAASSPCPAGAIMMGTGNVLTHELGLPRNPAAIADMLCNGPTIEVDLASANGEPFLLMAGAGFDARVVAGLSQTLKQRFARAAYGPATLAALKAPLDRLHVSIAGTEHTCAWVLVTSASRYGGAFRLTGRTSVRTPGLVAVLFRPRTRVELVAQAVALARGDLDRRAAAEPDWILTMACTAVEVRADTPVPVQIDGDVFGTTPLSVRAGAGRVSLIVPR